MSEAGTAGLVCVYKATGATDAYLIQHWLERNGVRAFVRGEALMSLRGRIPVGEAWPSVWVRAGDRDPAEAAIRLFHGPKLVHPEWTCPACGEMNGPAFGSCWSCGHDAPGGWESEEETGEG